MAKKAHVTRRIQIAKHRYILEVYLALEGHKEISWEIFPLNHKAALYAFSNKQKLETLIEKKYLYEPKK